MESCDADSILPHKGVAEGGHGRLFSLFVWLWTCLLMTAVLLMHGTGLRSTSTARFSSFAPPPLTAVTLSFNQTRDDVIMEHNCALLSGTAHEYRIYTDDVSRRYCRVCDCRMYKPVACTCPDPGRSDCNLCSKLHFMRDLLMQEREFVFLDSDVTVLHRDFLERLAIRARGFDFLASYGFAVPCATKLMRPFNSGVFFMRWIEGVDYQKLLRLPWELRSNNDQNALSAFVQREYREWDVLGMQWHCRFLAGGEVRIPAERCYTVHGRGPVVKEVMERANRTWLKVG